jgi:hypothetical protein
MTSSRLPYRPLGKVFSTSGLCGPLSAEKTARTVLVPPISPTSSIVLLELIDEDYGNIISEMVECKRFFPGWPT